MDNQEYTYKTIVLLAMVIVVGMANFSMLLLLRHLRGEPLFTERDKRIWLIVGLVMSLFLAAYFTFLAYLQSFQS